MAEPLLSVRDLRVLYSRAIEGIGSVSLDVAEGQTVAILGANGAGKTTTLRAITGFIGLDDARVAGGRVTFAGRDITGWQPHMVSQAGLVLVPEREKVFPNLTVAENLAVVAQRGASGDAVYDFFPRLGGLKNRLAGLLSGGERQMLAIGAALACAPRVLLIDELSLGLAPVIVDDLAQRLMRIRDELKLTMVIVEQNANLALRMADHGYVLEHGHVALSGTAAELRGDSRVQDLYLGGGQTRRSYREIGMAGLEDAP